MSRPPKSPALSVDAIVACAVRQADESGLDQLTMRALARALGVQAMSLYHHIPHKEALLDLMVDAVIAEVELPAADLPWTHALRVRATSLHATLLRHPWAPLLVQSRVNVGPAMLRLVDATIGCLLTAGFSIAEADEAWNAIDSFVFGFTFQQLNSPLSPDRYAEEAAAWLPTVELSEHPSLATMAHAVASGAHDGVNHLSFGLDLLLDGLAARRARCSQRAGDENQV